MHGQSLLHSGAFQQSPKHHEPFGPQQGARSLGSHTPSPQAAGGSPVELEPVLVDAPASPVLVEPELEDPLELSSPVLELSVSPLELSPAPLELEVSPVSAGRSGIGGSVPRSSRGASPVLPPVLASGTMPGPIGRPGARPAVASHAASRAAHMITRMAVREWQGQGAVRGPLPLPLGQ